VKPSLSVAENLVYWSAIYGAPETGRPAIEEALATQALDDLADLPARLLSAGQRRRLNLVRLTLSPGHLWLLDEPTVSLDADSVTRLENGLRAHLARAGSALIATHAPLSIDAHETVALLPARNLESEDA